MTCMSRAFSRCFHGFFGIPRSLMACEGMALTETSGGKFDVKAKLSAFDVARLACAAHHVIAP